MGISDARLRYVLCHLSVVDMVAFGGIDVYDKNNDLRVPFIYNSRSTIVLEVKSG